MQIPKTLADRLSRFGQQHLLEYWDQLSDSERTKLLRQIESLDFELIASLVESMSPDEIWEQHTDSAQSPPTANGSLDAQVASSSDVMALGNQVLADGQVAAILVAGGQGTRLGFEQPKGMLPVGPISQRTLFQILVDIVRARGQSCGVRIPLLIMTSPATHEATVQYFHEHDLLGLDSQDLKIFCQGTMPAVDLATGKILLTDRHTISLSPDGHGGMLQALVACGGLAWLESRGIKQLFYGQIDNPLTQLCDPLTLGYHVMARSEMTTQVVRKNDPLQRVGNVVSVDGRMTVIEYSDLPEALARQCAPDGSLRLWAGNIAVHVFDLAFLDRVKDQAPALPFHRARKKVACLDRVGCNVMPDSPNAIKFERFIFDLLPHAQRSIVVEVDPAEGFAAVKNDLNSATENLLTAQAAMIGQQTRWLRASGTMVAEGVPVEIHPAYALDVDQLRARVNRPRVVERPTYLAP